MKALKYLFTLLLLACFVQAGAQKRANKFYERYDFAKAIPLYEKHIVKNPGDNAAREKLATSFRMIKDYRSAEKWYAQVVKAKDVDPENYFYYGQSLMNNGQYDKAVPQLERYLRERGWSQMASNMLEASKNPSAFYQDSMLYKVRPVNINTPGPEFGPVLHNQTVIFAGPQNRDKVVFNWTGDAFLDLWAAPYAGNHILGEPVPLAGAVNSRYHEGGATFSPDGLTMYFTRNNYFQGKVKKDANRIVRLKAYKSEYIDGKWTNIEEFPFNSDEYSVGHPCMDSDGETIYFISDMPGGAGGTDIYMTKKLGPDRWSEPVSMGDKINSPGNEMFPWVSANGVLYFASDGHPGLGGLDVFRVTSLGGELEKVENLGYPVNTGQDDFALVVDDRTGQGFFTSNRFGGKGDDDLYSLRQKQVVEGVVISESTGDAIPDAKVEFYDANGLQVTAFSDAEGRFRCGLDRNNMYEGVADAELYLQKRERISTVSFDPRVPVEALFKLEGDLNCEPPFNLDGVVENDSMEILPNAKVTIFPQPFDVETDTNGKFNVSLQPEMDYEIRVGNPGYIDRVYNVSTKGMEPGDIQLDAVLAQLQEDTSLYNIFYDYDKSYLRSYSYKELDRVKDYLDRNPGVKIRLVSHADARGAAAYNNRLSRERSISAYEYLIREGVPKNRLEMVWVGESKPLNDCGDGVDCPEDEHQKNRRTEIQYGGTVPVEDDAAEKAEEPVELKLGVQEEQIMGEQMVGEEPVGVNPTEDSPLEEKLEGGKTTLENAIEEIEEEAEKVEGAIEETDDDGGMKEAAEEMEEAAEEATEEVEEATEGAEEAPKEVSEGAAKEVKEMEEVIEKAIDKIETEEEDIDDMD